MHTESPAVPNAIAAFLLHLRDTTGKIPHLYFGWSEGNPLECCGATLNYYQPSRHTS